MILGSPRFAGSFLDMFRSEKCVIMGIKDIEYRIEKNIWKNGG